MWRWALATLATVLLALLLLLAAVLWLPSGTRFALNLAAALLPQLELAGIDGTLASDLRIERLRYRHQAQTVDVNGLRLHWQPWALTRSLLRVHELSADRVQIELPAAVEPAGAARVPAPALLPSLPALTLPVAVAIERLTLAQVRVEQGDRVPLAALQLSLALHSQGQRLLIEPLQLQLPGSRLSLSGWVEPARQFSGHVEVQGDTDLTRWLRLAHWPEQLPMTATLVADFEGAGPTLSLTLAAEQAASRLQLQAQISDPAARVVQYQLQGQRLDPALASPDWPGALDLAAEGRVELGGEQPRLALQLSRLQGQLRQQPIEATAALDGDLRQWQVEALTLKYAGARAQFSGAVSDQLALQWTLNAPDLARLLPAAAGRLEASGRVQGPLRQPSVQARIRAERLAYADQVRLARLSGDLAIDLSGQQDWSADLELLAGEMSGQRLERGRLTLNGTPEQHRLTVSASGSPGQAELTAAGGWSAPQQRWQGQLERLALQPQAFGHWRSTGTAGLALSAAGYRLERFCVDEQAAGGRLCLQAEGSFAGQSRVQATLDRLALEPLSPLLEGLRLTPTLSAELAFSQQPGGQPALEARVQTSAGELIPAQADQRLPLAPLEARIMLAEDQLRLSAQTPLSFLAGELELALTVRGLSARQQLEGTLKLQAEELSLVSVLVPQLQNLQGRIGGQLSLGGTLAAPQLSGELSYREGSVELPALGLVVAPLTFRVEQSGLPGRVRFAASARSGEGTLDLAGDYDLARREGRLTLTGEQFTAMATAEIQARISPDLALALGSRDLHLSGELKLPYARISPPKSREHAVLPSADVVRIEQGQRLDKTPVVPVSADLQITLGDDVRVDALGFKGRLLGGLRIEERPGQVTRATGSIQVESGQYRLYGQDLDIRRGSLVYAAGPIDNPGLDLRIGRQVEQVVVGADISGTLREPSMDLYGEPAMPDSSVLSYLLLGKPPGEGSVAEQQLLMQAALAMGMSQGNRITGQLREALALDEFGFDSGAGDESAFFIGKYLSPRLYLRYGIGVLDAVNTLSLKYRLSDKWRMEAQSSELGSGADLLYTLER